jgi:hypothetical protein
MTILSRREFLRLATLAAASTALSACAPLYARLGGSPDDGAPGPAPTGAADWAALARLTYGPRPSERTRLAEVGLAAWIEEQLAPESLDDGPCDWRVRRFTTLGLRANEIAEFGEKLFDDVDKRPVVQELRAATLVRRVYSRRQLYEVLVEFWGDHFNISVDKGNGWFLKTVDDREVVRRYALGSFHDLLWASAHSPAMLVYLDNQANHRGAPNENYARELLELHTLGVHGGYTQADVMELARCLTGWTVKEHFWRGEFTFDEAQHDGGAKRVLGQVIEPAGQAEVEQVLARLAVHPSTASFVAGKLARRFLGAGAPDALVARAAEAFTRTQGDLRAVLRVILLDGLARSRRSPAGGPLAPKARRPASVLAGALRALGAETDGGAALQEHLARMGQLPFGWPTPDGYPERDEAWQNNLLPRWQFALALARGEIAGTTLDLPALLGDAPPVDALAGRLFGAPLAPAARADVLRALDAAPAEDVPALLAAALIGAPTFHWN